MGDLSHWMKYSRFWRGTDIKSIDFFFLKKPTYFIWGCECYFGIQFFSFMTTFAQSRITVTQATFIDHRFSNIEKIGQLWTDVPWSEAVLRLQWTLNTGLTASDLGMYLGLSSPSLSFCLSDFIGLLRITLILSYKLGNEFENTVHQIRETAMYPRLVHSHHDDQGTFPP